MTWRNYFKFPMMIGSVLRNPFMGSLLLISVYVVFHHLLGDLSKVTILT